MPSITILLIFISICVLVFIITNISVIFILNRKNSHKQSAIQQDIEWLKNQSTYHFDNIIQQHTQKEQSLRKELMSLQISLQKEFHQGHIALLKNTSEALQNNMADIRQQLQHSFKYHADTLTAHLKTINQEVEKKLTLLTQQVSEQLNQGFEKTSATFNDVLKRLVIIDEAQKKITELSTDVVSLQAILSDKRSRGAFGEIQLQSLIENMIPVQNFSFQYTLSNNKRVDCALFLPEPHGILAIDAKFPLENYQLMFNSNQTDPEKLKAKSQFQSDIKKHIKDISEKYIIPNETEDGAIMFIPAEAIFAEIHAHFPDLVHLAQQAKVWMVSPTTLMAILTTAKAVLKNDATKKQVHIIQKHLHALSQDFIRFEKRMGQLSKHISQANQDVHDVNISAKKISQKFEKIERVELNKENCVEIALSDD